MKKTKRILSLTALLLVAVTLLTSCGVNYRTADAADYVSIGEAGYKNVALSVDKTVISDEDIAQIIFDLQFKNKTVKKETNDDGKIKQYDVLSLRLAIYDDKKNVVFSQFGIDSSVYNNKDTKGKVAAVKGIELPIGYGKYAFGDVTLDSTNKITLPEGFLRNLEGKLYDATGEKELVWVNDHKIEDRFNSDGSVITTMETPFNGYFSVAYSTSYTKSGATSPTPGTTAGPLTIDTYAYEGKEITGKNSYQDAIYLGLKKYAENNKIYCKGTETNSLPISIHVVPTASTEELPAGDATSVYIKYDLDFENVASGKNYKKGTIATSILFAYVPYSPAPEGDPRYATPVGTVVDEDGNVVEYAMSYEFGSDYEGTYKSGTTTEKMAGKTFTICVYVEKRTPYELPALTADFIKDKADHADHMDDLTGTDEEVLEKYKAHLKKEMQEEADKEARLVAMTLLWEKAVKAASTEGKKSSDAFAKAYKKEEINYFRYMYYDYNYYGISMSAVYDSFEEYVVLTVNGAGYEDMLNASNLLTADKDGNKKLPLEKEEGSSTKYTKASIKSCYRLVESILLEQGRRVAKERALTYLLADLLDVRMTEDELEAKLAEAVKKANEDAKESIRAAITVDTKAGETEEEVKKTLVNALLLSDSSNKKKLEAMSLEQLGKHYLLQTYGVASIDALPEDLVTEESYLNAADKETVFGGYQMDAVKEKLLELNKSTVTYVEVDTDGNKLENTTDGE